MSVNPNNNKSTHHTKPDRRVKTMSDYSYVRAVVSSQTNEHNSDLPHLALRFELHLGFNGSNNVSFDDGSLITA